MPSGSRFPGEAAFHDVRDIHLAPVEVDHLKHIVQQVPAGPTKGMPCLSSCSPGPSPMKHYLRLFIADAEDEVPPRLAQRAAAAGGAVSF